MSRLLALIVVVLLIAGAMYFLSNMPKEVPAKTIVVDVPQGGNAQ